MSASNLVDLPFKVIDYGLQTSFDKKVAARRQDLENQRVARQTQLLDLQKNQQLQQLNQETARQSGALLAKYARGNIVNSATAKNALDVVQNNAKEQANYINEKARLSAPIARQYYPPNRSGRLLTFASSLLN